MSTLKEILHIENHVVAVYRSPSLPEDADVIGPKCVIPSLLMKCSRLGRKCTADREHVTCHGAVSGLGFGGIPDRERTSYSLSRIPEGMEGSHHRSGKRYFADPGCAMCQIDSIKDYGDGTDAIVFQDLDDAERENRPIEVVVFVTDPTRLSALMQLASYSKSTPGPASIAPFGHACQQVYAIPRAEGESDDPHGVIGMTDMYARRYVGLDQMTYAVPYSLYRRMTADIPGSFLEDEKYLENLAKSLRIHEQTE